MIQSKDDLKQYIMSDLGINNSLINNLIKRVILYLKGSETIPIYKTLYSLRHYEYYFNNKSHLSLCGKVILQYWRFKFRHYQLKYDLHIEPNTLESGVTIMHPGYRKIPDFCMIGKNCTILPMVLIGKKSPGLKAKAIIGNNCYIATGVTILAPVKIGNNVIIGAGAVVTKDIPDNCTVAGVPAKVIKYNN